MNGERLDVASMTDDELRAAAHGCTELTCGYHMDVNNERVRRIREALR